VELPGCQVSRHRGRQVRYSDFKSGVRRRVESSQQGSIKALANDTHSLRSQGSCGSYGSSKNPVIPGPSQIFNTHHHLNAEIFKIIMEAVLSLAAPRFGVKCDSCRGYSRVNLKIESQWGVMFHVASSLLRDSSIHTCLEDDCKRHTTTVTL